MYSLESGCLAKVCLKHVSIKIIIPFSFSGRFITVQNNKVLGVLGSIFSGVRQTLPIIWLSLGGLTMIFSRFKNILDIEYTEKK